ncbi:uncharacterized protein LOC129283055 [Lytechinus pictus]|uniref:uncharacterized protein LOC129283055 n=1 Tax=Lytechinus pictus TaxID=7653 RepID=UPI00240E810D|nr:uncharacterized protein LOC129283055 [Lytechinus pictus]
MGISFDRQEFIVELPKRQLCFIMNDLRCGCISLHGAFLFAVFAVALCRAGEQSGSYSSSKSPSITEGVDNPFPHPSSPSPRLSILTESSITEDIQGKTRKPRCIYDNGAIRILLEELILELFRDLDDMNIDLNSSQKYVLRRRLRGFYHKATKHPAVHEKKIAFSSTKPTHYHGDEEKLKRDSPTDLRPLSNEIMSKRSGQIYESCETVADWDIVDHGRVKNETVVELFPKSWFFIRKCVSKGRTCNIGNENLSSLVSNTMCLEQSTWVPAYVRQKGYSYYEWEFIQVPSCCSCAVYVANFL